MKGLALLLKGLYPKLDWSTPEATLKSLAPGVDIGAIAGRLDSGLRLMAEAAERQIRIEAMLTELMVAWEHARASRAAGHNNPPADLPRIAGGAAKRGKRHPNGAAA